MFGLEKLLPKPTEQEILDATIEMLQKIDEKWERDEAEAREAELAAAALGAMSTEATLG